MHECLDVKTQRRAYFPDIFPIQLLEYSGLACVVEPTDAIRVGPEWILYSLQEQYTHFFLFLPIFSDNCEQSHSFSE